MFPSGEPGWHTNILKADGAKRNRGRKHNRSDRESSFTADYLDGIDNTAGKLHFISPQ